MKNTTPKATKTVYPIICQIVNTIPAQFIAETAKAHKVLSRTFSPKSHVAAMLYCQVSKTESLNSICDVALANETLWTSMGVSVPRQKRNMKMTVVKELRPPAAATPEKKTQILKDEIVVPAKESTAAKYGGTLRRVTAVVEIQGQMKEQTCQIHDFIGYSENAVQWQVWTGLLAHLILRYLAYLSKWGLSFSRLAGVVRGTLWIRRNLIETLCLHGTAGPVKAPSERPKRLYFQAVLEFGPGAMGQQTC